MLLAEELLLMCLDPSSGRPSVRVGRLKPALGGAVLVELVLRERIGLTPDGGRRRRVQLISAVPTDDSELDFVITHLQTWTDITVAHLIRDVSGKRIVERLGNRLVGAGVLREAPATRFGTRAWPTDDLRPATDIRARVHAAVTGTAQPTESTVALVCLLDAVRQLPEVVLSLDPAADRKAITESVRRLGEGDWASRAVKQAITQLRINSVLFDSTNG